MDPLNLIMLTVALSSSGALSPGPLTMAAVVEGARGSWRAGLKAATGHMTFELPYVVAIGLAAYQLRYALDDPVVKYALAALMGAFLAYFSAVTALDGLRLVRGRASDVKGLTSSLRGPFTAGLAFTAFNPFFLLWWLTVGLVLVEAASGLGLLVGYSIMYPSHVWMDYAWLTLMASLGEGGRRVLRSRGYGALLIALAALMAGVGAYALTGLA